ncbi:MAG: phosphoglycerate kinase [Tepidiformaceae bacterium]
MSEGTGKKTIRDVDVAGTTVLVRSDLNVPIDRGTVADDTRIRESLPTIQYLLDHGAKVIVCSHLGRPKGRDESLSLAPVAGRMGNLMNREVLFVEDCIGEEVRQAVAEMVPNQVLLLENLRFHPGEEANDPEFARQLAAPAQLFVDDAFGSAHRAHASTVGVTQYLPAVAGFLLEKEVRYLKTLVEDPPKPFAAVIGGAKVSSKIPAIEHLLPRLDMLLLGGGMANTFLKAEGFDVGMSLVEDEQVDAARRILAQARGRGVQVHLPRDVVAAERFEAGAGSRTVPVAHVPRGYMILDIGPETVKEYAVALRRAKTVVWNGPMGVFEWPKFAHGSHGVAKAIAALDATTVVGGGETAQVVTQLGLQDQFTHVSTGGGASLEMLEGRELPGVAALEDA